MPTHVVILAQLKNLLMKSGVDLHHWNSTPSRRIPVLTTDFGIFTFQIHAVVIAKNSLEFVLDLNVQLAGESSPVMLDLYRYLQIAVVLERCTFVAVCQDVCYAYVSRHVE